MAIVAESRNKNPNNRSRRSFLAVDYTPEAIDDFIRSNLPNVRAEEALRGENETSLGHSDTIIVLIYIQPGVQYRP